MKAGPNDLRAWRHLEALVASRPELEVEAAGEIAATRETVRALLAERKELARRREEQEREAALGQELRLVSSTDRARLDRDRVVLLGLVAVTLPRRGEWRAEGLDDPKGQRAVSLLAMDAGGDFDEICLLAVDTTGDPDEPELTDLSEASLAENDRAVRDATEREAAATGQEIVEWFGSSVVAGDGPPRLLSRFTLRLDGLVMEMQVVRLTVAGRRLQVAEFFPPGEGGLVSGLQDVQDATDSGGG
jgi:hypothetical protein